MLGDRMNLIDRGQDRTSMDDDLAAHLGEQVSAVGAFHQDGAHLRLKLA